MEISPSINYQEFYPHYKRLPYWIAIITAICLSISAITCIILLYAARMPIQATLTLVFACPIIYFLSLCNYFLLATLLSPTVLRTDAVLHLEKHLCPEKEIHTPNGDADTFDQDRAETAKAKEDPLQNSVLCSSARPSSDAEGASSTKGIPIKVWPTEDNMIICPKCNTKQPANRYRCFHCEQVFINKQPNIPYWCGKCGNEGPFEGNCPECQSSIKIMNH